MESLQSKTLSQDKEVNFDDLLRFIGSINADEDSRPFIIDQDNREVIELLYYYFKRCEKKFLQLASMMKIDKPSLLKGIMLVGNVGTGKTRIMSFFAKHNTFKRFSVVNAKKISEQFEMSGIEGIRDYYDLHTFHTPPPICVDDFGTEIKDGPRNYMGNRCNVLAEIIERRYDVDHLGCSFHVTSNLTGDDIEAFYDLRVRSRLKEKMNWIELFGPDRRK